jgi:hypothetical protein
MVVFLLLSWLRVQRIAASSPQRLFAGSSGNDRPALNGQHG